MLPPGGCTESRSYYTIRRIVFSSSFARQSTHFPIDVWLIGGLFAE